MSSAKKARVDSRGLMCVSVSEKSLEATLAAMEGQEMAEIRMDLMYPEVSRDDFSKIFAMDLPIIVTCRDVGGQDGWGPLRKELLTLGITGGATHVDIEVEAPAAWKEEMIALARQNDVKVIVSHHNYANTPDNTELRRIVEECFSDGADIAKIAVAAQTNQDAARVLGMYDDTRKLVLLAMGEKGKITRVAGPLMGSPFTFVAASEAAATAPGQLTATSMEALYKAMM